MTIDMTDRFIRERVYAIDEARRFASVNGIKLCKRKDTGRFEFVNTISAAYEPATWDELKNEMEERGLAIYGSGTHLRVAKVMGDVL